MKKLTRTERRVMIERGKTVAIVVLCLCCVIFLYSIWDLYKGQVSIGQAFWGTERVPASGNPKTEDVVGSFRNYTEPELIMVSQANTRAVLKTDDSLYVSAVSIINDVMKSVYDRPADAFEVSDNEAFRNLASNGMIYAKYPCVKNTSFETPFVASGESGMTTAIKKYGDVIIAPHASTDNGVTVLIRDGDTGQMFNVETKYPSKDIQNIISGCQYKKNNSFVFAHELNLDTPKTDEAAVMLDSMFIIPLEKTAVNNIVTSVPEKYVQGIGFSHTNEFTTELLNVFGYNPNTVRQYAKDNGAVIFVGDSGSLSLYPNGKIEYKALGESEGISFITTGRTQADPRGVVSGLNGIINDVLSGCGMGEENSCANLRITEMPDMSSPAELRVCMEYYTDNRKVLLGTTPAVDAVIRNGVLIELTMNVKTVHKTEQITPCEDAFAAIDAFCEKNPQCKSIKSGSLVYKAFEDGKEVSAIWQIQGE